MKTEIKQRIEQIKNGEVPEGYTCKYHVKPDLWIDKPLKEFFYKVKEKNYEKKYGTVFTNSAANGVILQSQYFEKDIANKENIDGYYIVRAGDYIYNPRISEKAPYGPINQNLTGYIGIASPLYTIFAKREKVCVCEEYVRYYLSSTEWNKYIYSVANYGARFDRMNISDGDFMKMPIAMPPIEEQQKIAEILMQCDKVIELYQKEIDELQKLKKAYLRKMFPQKGSKVPELRFVGFTDAWEQRKLGEVLISLQNNTLSRAELSTDKGVAKDVHYGDILVKFGEVLDINKEQLPMIANNTIVEKYKTSFLQDGDVIVADTAEDVTVGKCTEIVGLGREIVISGLHTIPYRPLFNFASGYLGYYMNSPAYHSQLLPFMRGIKVTSISKSDMQNTGIVYPKAVDEQKQIGEYFRNFDNLITLHQRKLDEQKKQKKALMQLLLTGIVRV